LESCFTSCLAEPAFFDLPACPRGDVGTAKAETTPAAIPEATKTEAIPKDKATPDPKEAAATAGAAAEALELGRPPATEFGLET